MKIPFNLKIDPELLERLRKYSKESGMPVAEAMRRAADAWLTMKEMEARDTL